MIVKLEFASRLTTKQRFKKFIEWGVPGGKAGFNEFVGDDFDMSLPYIKLTKRFFVKGDKVVRVSGIKAEYNDRAVLERLTGKVINHDGLIEEPFLSFFKAWLNVWMHYSKKRSRPKHEVVALKYIERSLRRRKGNNKPWNIDHDVLVDSINELKKIYSPRYVYDVSQFFNVMAGMMNSGYKSASYNFHGQGFNLFSRPFSFKNPIHNGRGKRVSKEGKNNIDDGRLSHEDVFCIARAYGVAIEKHGSSHYLTYFSALCALAVICSVRISEIFSVKTDSLFYDDLDKRWKLSVFRYKSNELNDVPLPNKLVAMAKSVFQTLIEYTESSRKLLCHYVGLYENPADISEVLLPPRLKNKTYILAKDIELIFGCRGYGLSSFIHNYILKHHSVEFVYGVDLAKDTNVKDSMVAYSLKEVKKLCKMHGVVFNSIGLDSLIKYISTKELYKGVGKAPEESININLKNLTKYKPVKWYMRRDIEAIALNDVKNNFKRMPHWPYVDSNHYIHLSDMLCVEFDLSSSDSYFTNKHLPNLTLPSLLNGFVSKHGSNGLKEKRNLFEMLGVCKRDGTYSEFTIHCTRKYHQTEALLRGVPAYINDMYAGRKTGLQSSHYDLRTDEEVLVQSIDFFESDKDYDVIGPDADVAPNDPIERKIFFKENTAPKHVHELGGCSADWSLNPCEQYGGCFGCGSHVWMKGDVLRLPFVKDAHKFMQGLLKEVGIRIANGNDSKATIKHRQQIISNVHRCEEIFSVEKNKHIVVGTLITFSKTESSFTTEDHVSYLKKSVTTKK